MHKNFKNWVLKLIVTSSLSGIFQPKIIKLNITVEVPLSSNNFCKIIIFVKCQIFARQRVESFHDKPLLIGNHN